MSNHQTRLISMAELQSKANMSGRATGRTGDYGLRPWGADADSPGGTSIKDDEPHMSILTKPRPKGAAAIARLVSDVQFGNSLSSRSIAWEERQAVGQRLDARRYLANEEKFMVRRVSARGELMPRSRRVFVDLDASAGESSDAVGARAAKALAAVGRIAETGEPVTLMALWCCQNFDCTSRDSIIMPLESPSFETLALVSSVRFLRTWMFGASDGWGPLGPMPVFSLGAGRGSPVHCHADLVEHLVETGAAEPGDIVYDNNKSLDDQVPLDEMTEF